MSDGCEKNAREAAVGMRARCDAPHVWTPPHRADRAAADAQAAAFPGDAPCASAVRDDAVLEFDGVSFRYEGAARDAVRDVSLRVRRGSVVAVTGESGCGKTTLMRMANALIPLAYAGGMAGEVRVAGRPMGRWTANALARTVGSVFQNPRSQFVNADVASEMAFGCESLGMPRDEIARRVMRAAAAFGVSDLLGRDVCDLSGGQRQMVMLASVAAPGPEIYVLDEPTASLDVPAMKILARAVATLKAAGKTVLVSEHRLWWLADTADRVVVMRDGRIQGDYPARDFARIPAVRRRVWGLRAWSVEEMEAEALARCEGAPVAAPCPRPPARSDGAAGPAPARFADPVRAAVPARAEPIVCAVGLTAGYRHAPAVLDGVDFAIGPGRITALAGRNGAGKSTLARCLSGLVKERGGAVFVEGRKASWRRRAGLVYPVMQEPGYQLFCSTVDEELRDAASRSGTASGDMRPCIDRMIADLGLEGLEGAHPLSLSGGQRQRLSIGAGLLYGARALVLDEPTSGLDRANMERIAERLNALKRAGAGICVITHDFELLCAVCDEVARLEGGRIVETLPFDRAHLARIEALFGFG